MLIIVKINVVIWVFYINSIGPDDYFRSRDSLGHVANYRFTNKIRVLLKKNGSIKVL